MSKISTWCSLEYYNKFENETIEEWGDVEDLAQVMNGLRLGMKGKPFEATLNTEDSDYTIYFSADEITINTNEDTKTVVYIRGDEIIFQAPIKEEESSILFPLILLLLRGNE